VLNEDLRTLSIRDELTGLYNRRGFMERGGALLQTARSEGLALLVMFADMDKLKTINDNYGHDEGDRAISMVAGLLKSCLPVGSIISRLGGDEYTAIIPLARIEGAEAVVRERINKELTAHSRQSGLPYSLSISMGFALFDPERPAAFSELIKQADDHQYMEKRKKRNAG
jgi:two-component system, cell cycle response regulator